MDKKELVQVHRLLAMIQDDMETRADQTFEEALSHREYADTNVAPNHVHRSRTDHEDAVQALLSDIVRATEVMDDADLSAQEEQQLQQVQQQTEEESSKPVQFTDYS